MLYSFFCQKLGMYAISYVESQYWGDKCREKVFFWFLYVDSTYWTKTEVISKYAHHNDEKIANFPFNVVPIASNNQTCLPKV